MLNGESSKNWLMNECILVERNCESKAIMPHKKGWLLTVTEAKELISELEEYIKHEDEINLHNAERQKGIDEHYQRCSCINHNDDIPIKRKCDEGYIYIIKIDEHFKIGKAKDMKGRMGEYTKLPIEPEIVFLKKVKDYTLAEKTLHSYFADKRGRGEWFNLTNEDVKLADAVIYKI